jgi:anti-sigma regulatory factor (Ser/Thr protein kinase)
VNGDEVEIPLAGTRADVGAGRQFVRETVEGWGYGDVAEDAVLIASELITNAVLHARTRLEVTVRQVSDRIRIEVTDKSHNLPQLRRHSLQSATGRGLHLVAALASDWGADARSDGKVVWVELTTRIQADDSGHDHLPVVVDLDAFEALGAWDDATDEPSGRLAA